MTEEEQPVSIDAELEDPASAEVTPPARRPDRDFSQGPDATVPGREADRSPETAFEEFAAAWVPPWARSMPELMIEPAAAYTAEELAVGRLAYAQPEDLPNPDEFEPGLGDPELRGAVEAIMLVVDEPVATTMLAQVLEEPTARVDATLRSLSEEYANLQRGHDLRQVAGGWRLYTRSVYAPFVERFVLDGQQIRLTQAALETLAVVAYRQPVSRARVSAIRGVNVDGVMRTLVIRGLVEEAGEDHSTGAHLYRTSSYFLERIGVTSLDELPELAPYLPDLEDLEELEDELGSGRSAVAATSSDDGDA
jgi:segregation and condensation protein B